MSWLEALILGIIQGLTEFLPVSSSGHLELGKHVLGVEVKESLMFTVLVHGATVLSSLVVFRKEIANLFTGVFKFSWNQETQYTSKIFLSMIPVGIVGVLFKDDLETLFGADNIVFVGCMLIITGILLAFTFYAKPREREIGFKDSLIIGLAQAVAVLPGISRSGSTIATGLLLGNKREEVAKFSFLMVLIPILGEIILDLFKGGFNTSDELPPLTLLVGFVAAFLSGLLACKFMINIVKKGKLIYFAIYCGIAGLAAIFLG